MNTTLENYLFIGNRAHRALIDRMILLELFVYMKKKYLNFIGYAFLEFDKMQIHLHTTVINRWKLKVTKSFGYIKISFRILKSLEFVSEL